MKRMIILISTLLLCTTLAGPSVYSSSREGENLPSSFSWRDIDGVDYTTAIKDQSPAPTCEAYALCASLETIMQYQLGERFDPDLSETHLYFYAGGSVAAGYVNIIDAANYLKEYGVPDEGCNPDPHRPFDYPFESLPGWENRTVKISEWGWVNHDEESIKRALIDHGPLIICIFFWSDFYLYKGGVYHHRWGPRTGGHVVTIVGYDDQDACWIVKNSWGSDWGENGWFKMSYDADMFAGWYGEGTGIMYIDGVYGNLKPDAPEVEIETPQNFHTYLFGMDVKTMIKKLPLQKAAARILGDFTVEVSTEGTNYVDFYVDSEKQYRDDEPPFAWELQANRGLHTLEVRAYKGNNVSLDILDFYVLV